MVVVLVGLGNPGPRYAGTRHNFGFEAVERMAREAGVSWRRGSSGCLVAEATLVGRPVLLAKPQTYMNLSGTAVAGLVQSAGAEPSDVVVFLDDIALPLGVVRIRERGGHGGHRGLSSVLLALGREEVPRVRLGIRPGFEPEDLSDFVLAPFSPEERRAVEAVLDRCLAATRTLLSEGLAKAMSIYNNTPCSS